MKPTNWVTGYHIRTSYGVTVDFTLDLAEARKTALKCNADLYEVTRSSGRSVKL